MLGGEADGGPFQQAWIMSSTWRSGPENTASTPPRRLRTHPFSLRAVACSAVQARYHTPWTRPVMHTRKVM